MPHVPPPVVLASVEVSLEPAAAFAAFLDAIRTALAGRGLRFEPAGPGGRVVAGDEEVGRVTDWQAGQRAVLSWRAAPWDPESAGELEIRSEPADRGAARVVVEQRGWLGALGGGEEPLGWFADAVAAPLLAASSPAALGDWLTDRRARRPAGPASRATYRDPFYHRPMFRAILAELDLGPSDRLLDVGCGGGAFLADALRSGCQAAGVDHSPDMVRVARELNSHAIRDGRLEILEGDAAHLPLPDASFTAAVMHGVLGFLPDPGAAIAEMRRVLAPGGRLMMEGSDPAWKGTPAAPEPMGSRLRFYTDDALVALARDAGFSDVRVERRPVEEYAREVGVPEEHLWLFAGPGAVFLLGTRS